MRNLKNILARALIAAAFIFMATVMGCATGGNGSSPLPKPEVFIPPYYGAEKYIVNGSFGWRQYWPEMDRQNKKHAEIAAGEARLKEARIYQNPRNYHAGMAFWSAVWDYIKGKKLE